jgi:hypothetical protein
MGFTSGKIHPDMDPSVLVNVPWWKEPILVQEQNLINHIKYLERLYNELSFYSTSLTPIIAELD